MSIYSYESLKDVQPDRVYKAEFYASVEQMNEAKTALSTALNECTNPEQAKALLWLGLQLKNVINGVRQ